MLSLSKRYFLLLEFYMYFMFFPYYARETTLNLMEKIQYDKNLNKFIYTNSMAKLNEINKSQFL